MEIKITESDQSINASFSGELDHHSAPLAREMLDMAIERHPRADLRLDMRSLSFMDSSGIGMVMGRYKKVNAHNKCIYVTNTNPTIDRIFLMSGLYGIIKR